MNINLINLNRNQFGKNQRGVGMVEVLVAMLLLAIGVLGYAALQVRAVEATGEALNRSQAMTILRGLAENIRVNSAAQDQYPTKVHAYASLTASSSAPTSCVAPAASTATCTATQLADYDAFQAASTALKFGMHLDMFACPLTAAIPASGGASAVAATDAGRQCLVAAWGVTTPTSGTNTATDCLTTTGSYQSAARCSILEVY